MNTVKKSWITPKATLEEFTPNEYVFSTCWTVACSVGGKNNQNPNYYGNSGSWSYWGGKAPSGDPSKMHDHSGSCSSALNNQFRVDDNGNVVFDFENSSELGTLRGGKTYLIDNGTPGVSQGDVIFWYTTTTDKTWGTRRWNHWGTVDLADPNHPNHS